MSSHRTGFLSAAAAAGLAVSLALSACGPQPGAPAAGPEVTASTTADRATQSIPRASITASQAPATAAPPASPAPSAQHTSPARKTFTFPDGHISFTYPEAWTVRTVRPPAGLPGVEAIVADGAGNDLLSLANGVTAGCAAGPVSRRVFDRMAVPAMTAPDGKTPSFGFAVETVGNADTYVMGLTDPRSLQEGEGVASWCNLVATANGGLFSRVLFNDPAFPDRAAAQAWMVSDQYVQLKALLASLRYA